MDSYHRIRTAAICERYDLIITSSMLHSLLYISFSSISGSIYKHKRRLLISVHLPKLPSILGAPAIQQQILIELYKGDGIQRTRKALIAKPMNNWPNKQCNTRLSVVVVWRARARARPFSALRKAFQFAIEWIDRNALIWSNCMGYWHTRTVANILTYEMDTY